MGSALTLGEVVLQVALLGCPGHRKEVRQRSLDRRVRLLVPVHAQDEVAADRPGDPDALDGARSLDISELKGLARIHPNGRAAFPAAAQAP